VVLEDDAERPEALDVDVLDRGGRRLHDDLVLEVLLDAVGVLAVATVVGTPRLLDVADLPGPLVEDTEKGVRRHRPGPDLEVVGLGQVAALSGPEPVQAEDQVLDGHLGLPLPAEDRNSRPPPRRAG
jgi:hypothetical protein